MKLAALAVVAAVLSLGLPAPSEAQNHDAGSGSSLDAASSPAIANPQQAQLGALSDRDRYCENLRERATTLRNQAARSRDHGDFAGARDDLEDINERLVRDCQD